LQPLLPLLPLLPLPLPLPEPPPEPPPPQVPLAQLPEAWSQPAEHLPVVQVQAQLLQKRAASQTTLPATMAKVMKALTNLKV
jgi:hypothetical protein